MQEALNGAWEIKPLYYGKIEGKVSSWYPQLMPALTQDSKHIQPYIGFLLRSADEIILLDNGVHDRFLIDGKAWGGFPAETGVRFVREALKKEGLNVEDIKTVVYTQLHNDHAGNCAMFPDAVHVFQRDETVNPLNPLPVQVFRRDYDLEVIPELRNLKTLSPDGDYLLRDGVMLYKTTGHTLGSQSIAANTKKGIVVYIGDLAHFYCTLFPWYGKANSLDGTSFAPPKPPDHVGPAIPTSPVYNYYDFYDSIAKVKAIASRPEPGYILPGHESLIIMEPF
jgi:N-acyl homoserine lactone hydrolase